MIDERSKMFLEESPVMREIHEKAQQEGVGCLNVTKVAEKTGLKYVDGGKVVCKGGYRPWDIGGQKPREGGIKEALIRWRWIDGDIADIQREMRLLDSRFNDPAITNYVERMKGKGLPSGIEELLINREKLERQFMDELSYLLDVRSRIDRFVAMLDEFDREVITLRFLKGLEWEAVAEIVGRNHTRVCFKVHQILEHYDTTGEYLRTKRYRRHRKAK